MRPHPGRRLLLVRIRSSLATLQRWDHKAQSYLPEKFQRENYSVCSANLCKLASTDILPLQNLQRECSQRLYNFKQWRDPYKEWIYHFNIPFPTYITPPATHAQILPVPPPQFVTVLLKPTSGRILSVQALTRPRYIPHKPTAPLPRAPVTDPMHLHLLSVIISLLNKLHNQTYCCLSSII